MAGLNLWLWLYQMMFGWGFGAMPADPIIIDDGGFY